MKFLNKIDQYLIENHPLIWMSKLHYMLPVSILVNVVFWFWGYGFVDFEVVQHSRLGRSFEDSQAIYFYSLTIVMSLIVWALVYFKKSAVRHLYPIGKFYFTRLLALLFANFLLIVSPYLSFRSGTNAKTQKLANYEELKNQLDMVNLASAFLPISSGAYEFDNYYHMLHPDLTFSDSETWGYEESNFCNYNPMEHPENNDTTISGTVFQLLKEKRYKESCKRSYNSCVVGFVPAPEKYLEEQSKLSYYVYEFISSDVFNRPTNAMFNEYYYVDDSHRSLELNKKIRSVLRDKEQIRKLLNDYDRFLDKYQVPHSFQTDITADYFFKEKGKFRNGFVTNEFHDNFYGYAGDGEIIMGETNKGYALDRYTQISNRTTSVDLERNNGDSFFMIDQSSLRNMFSISRSSYYWSSFYFEVMIILFVALAIALVFLVFSFADFLILIVSIPITGAIIVIDVLICALFYSVYREDDYLIFVPLATAAAIASVYVIQLFRKDASRKITHGLGYVTSMFSGLFLIGLVVGADILFHTQVYECRYYTTKHLTLFNWLEDPGFDFVLSLIGILLFTLSIKRLIAKPD